MSSRHLAAGAASLLSREALGSPCHHASSQHRCILPPADLPTLSAYRLPACLPACLCLLTSHAVPYPRVDAVCGDLVTFRWAGKTPQTVALVKATSSAAALGECRALHLLDLLCFLGGCGICFAF